MTRRSVVMVVVLSILTLHVYALIWLVKTKDELNERGASVPSGWLLLIPIVRYWWLWHYSAGVEHVTRGRLTQVTAFIALCALGLIGVAILQDRFNRDADESGLPVARVVI